LESIGFKVDENVEYHKEASLLAIRDRINELARNRKKVDLTKTNFTYVNTSSSEGNLKLNNVSYNDSNDTALAGGYYDKYVKYKIKYNQLKTDLLNRNLKDQD